MWNFLSKLKKNDNNHISFDHFLVLESQISKIQERHFNLVERVAYCEKDIKEIMDDYRHSKTSSKKSKKQNNKITASELYTLHADDPDSILKPSELVKELDRFIVGQDDAKKALAVTFCNYVYSNNMCTETEIEKNNLVLIGHSGCGKTYLVKTLANIVDIPFISVDATEFSATGYKGKDVHLILEDLVANLNTDTDNFNAIIFVDEIDKIASKASGEYLQFERGVQSALLKIIEGEEYTVQGRIINTKNILFIFGGAFEDLYKTSEKRAIGFGTQDPAEIKKNIITPENLVNYGLMKEFVARLGQIIELSPLTDEIFKKILIEPQNSIVKQYNELFKIQQIEDEVSEEDIDQIVEKAKKTNCGARSLKNAAAEHFRNRFYR